MDLAAGGRMQVKITGPICDNEEEVPLKPKLQGSRNGRLYTASAHPSAGEGKHEQQEQRSITCRTAEGEEAQLATAAPAAKGRMRQLAIVGPTDEDEGTEAQVSVAALARVDDEEDQAWAPEDLSLLARSINALHARGTSAPVFASALFPEGATRAARAQKTRVDKRRRMAALLEQAEKNQWVKLDRTTGHLKVIIRGPVVFNKSQPYQGAPLTNVASDPPVEAAMPQPLPHRKRIPGAPGIDFSYSRSSPRGATNGAERRLPPPPKVAPPQRN